MFSVKIDDKQVQKFFKTSPRRSRWAMSEALKMTGGHYRKQMREFIEKGGEGWPPLSPITREQKMRAGGKTTPLYFLGRFIRYKYVQGQKGQKVSFGFFPSKMMSKTRRLATGQKYTLTAKGRRESFKRSFGMSPHMLLKYHELGKKRRVTERMRRRFAAMGYPLKKGTTSVSIPARPIISTIFKKEKNKIPKYIERRFFQKFFSKENPRLAI